MSDAFEDQARALAHSIPVCDLGSTAGIRAIAIGLRETWRMATEAADEELSACKERCRWAERRANEAEAKATLLEQTRQNGAEMIRAAHARAEAAEAERDRMEADLKEIGLEPFHRKGFTRVIGSEEITPPAISSTTEQT